MMITARTKTVEGWTEQLKQPSELEAWTKGTYLVRWYISNA